MALKVFNPRLKFSWKHNRVETNWQPSTRLLTFQTAGIEHDEKMTSKVYNPQLTFSWKHNRVEIIW